MDIQTWKHNAVDLEIQAVELTHDNVTEVAKWCNGLEVREYDAEDRSKEYVGVNVPTLEGKVRASEGAFITKDIQGRFTVRSPGRFKSLWHMQ